MSNTPDSINGQSITTTKARPRLGQSAPAKWARLQQQKGNCRSCGKDRRTPEEIAAGVQPGESKMKQLCRPCRTKVNAYMNKYRAAKKAAVQSTTPATPEVVDTAIVTTVETAETVETKENGNDVDTRTNGASTN